MFRGVYEHTLDSKGRVSVPKRFRDGLLSATDTQVVLTRGLNRCLVVYSMDRWRHFEERVLSRSQFDVNVIRAKRIFVAGAQECELDAQGRILIPPALRAYAEFDRDLAWVGQLDSIELWSMDKWQKAYDNALLNHGDAMTFDDAFAEALANLGL